MNKKDIQNSEREKIIQLSKNKFFEEGFHKVSIDELAKEFRVSKKTIYKHFPTKEKLVFSVIHGHLNETSGKILKIMDSKQNIIRKLIAVFETVHNAYKATSKKLLTDIQNHNPKLWEYIDDFRRDKLYYVMSEAIKQGKKNKLFVDADPDIILQIFTGAIRAVINPEFLVDHSISSREAFFTTTELLLNGILTNKGKTIFKKSKIGEMK